jgi:hypothetical protein
MKKPQDLEVQSLAAQNGIKYVMAVTCILFKALIFAAIAYRKLWEKEDLPLDNPGEKL